MTKSLLSYMQPTPKEITANFQIQKREERDARKPVSLLPSFGKAWMVEDVHLLFPCTYSSALEQTQF